MLNKYLYFEGVKFTRDDKTGYYLNSTLHKRMHRYVWEYYNGAIPKGYQIHHKDHNRANNNIENLEMLPTSTHAKKHGDERTNNHYDEMCANLAENARPKAVEWHKSEAGIEWHKKHYQKTKTNNSARRDHRDKAVLRRVISYPNYTGSGSFPFKAV